MKPVVVYRADFRETAKSSSNVPERLIWRALGKFPKSSPGVVSRTLLEGPRKFSKSYAKVENGMENFGAIHVSTHGRPRGTFVEHGRRSPNSHAASMEPEWKITQNDPWNLLGRLVDNLAPRPNSALRGRLSS